jgi:hypothetical protein
MEAEGFGETAVHHDLSNYTASLHTIYFVLTTGADGAVHRNAGTLAARSSNRHQRLNCKYLHLVRIDSVWTCDCVGYLQRCNRESDRDIYRVFRVYSTIKRL